MKIICVHTEQQYVFFVYFFSFAYSLYVFSVRTFDYTSISLRILQTAKLKQTKTKVEF